MGNDEFEYKRIKIKSVPDILFINQLQSYGDDGWEMLDYENTYHHERIYYLNARKNLKTNTSWEYKVFNTSKYLPSGWFDHLKSCGWIEFSDYTSYMSNKQSLFKRDSFWRGHDDGDIIQRVIDCNMDKYRNNAEIKIINEVLQIKWEQSQKEGHDIGTYPAVLIWLNKN